MKRKSTKSESRVLAISYYSGSYYLMVFRKNFLEEFLVLDEKEIFSIDRALEHLNTRDEVSYYVLCNDNKYSHLIPGLKILEGSEYLLQKIHYCVNLLLIAKCFENIRMGGFTNNCRGGTYG